jgi:hypothetical protein
MEHSTNSNKQCKQWEIWGIVSLEKKLINNKTQVYLLVMRMTTQPTLQSSGENSFQILESLHSNPSLETGCPDIFIDFFGSSRWM